MPPISASSLNTLDTQINFIVIIGGSAAPVVSALALRSGDLTRSSLSLNFFPGSPWFNFLAAPLYGQLFCLRPIGILNSCSVQCSEILATSYSKNPRVNLTNRKWFSVVCTLIDNDIRHHSSVVDASMTRTAFFRLLSTTAN